MLIKRMKTSTPEGRDRSAMGKGGGRDTHAHPHTNEGEKGGGSHTTLTIPHSSNNSFIPIATFKIGSQVLREEKCFLRELRKEEIEFVSLMFLGKAFHTHTSL